jgi:hypothetical protein
MDKLGYVFMRDVVLACLPKGISMTLRNLDQKMPGACLIRQRKKKKIDMILEFGLRGY